MSGRDSEPMAEFHFAISKPRVPEAFREVAREAFLPAGPAVFAYPHASLPIGEGQTIFHPCVVAVSVDHAALRGAENVLEIGTRAGQWRNASDA